jgi:Aspartyl protease
MRKRNLCLLSLLLLLALAGEASAGGYADGKPLRFDLYYGYLIVVRGGVGPFRNLHFLLDTGASPSIVDRKLMQKLHLGETPGVLAGINGRVQAGLTTVPSLQFGAVRKENFPAVIEDLSFFDKALPVRVDAVIGLDVLGQVPFEIDYASGRILFGSIASLEEFPALADAGGTSHGDRGTQ